MDCNTEYQESTAITFEWTLRGLKGIFEATKGDAKSKVMKSALFGGGRWQILFYANAGTTGRETSEGFVSLYLSCEPTAEERQGALADGKWVREGVYKFSFELRNIGKSVIYNFKEAQNHTFSHKTMNWGWAQFARRDTVFSQSSAILICTITSSPATPSLPPSFPRQSVPRGLLDTVGSLLDDPLYSDVEFILPRRGQSKNSARKIQAARQLLKRSEYFEAMFSPDFAEGLGALDITLESSAQSTVHTDLSDSAWEDSDDEDDIETCSSDSVEPALSASDPLGSYPTSMPLPAEGAENKVTTADLPSGNASVPGPRKHTVIVKDVAYATYFAILYYIYTDTIVFAPLSSSFSDHSSTSSNLPSPTWSEMQGNTSVGKRLKDSLTRKDWIKDWQMNNPGKPAPCSAKSAYRLADKLDLRDLKERAAQHIFKSLAVDNIAYEVFSPFAAAFEDIRKVQVKFFLEHWTDIRASESMRDVWQQIRNGGHPGFEEVWPLIAQSLEFKPPPSSNEGAAGGDN